MTSNHTASRPSGKAPLSVAVLDFDERRRKAVADVLSGIDDLQIEDIPTFPLKVAELPQVLPENYSIVLLNVDCDPDLAFDLAEKLSADQMYVMAYSSRANMKIAVQMMRAGAREFFNEPLDRAEVAEAINRATEHYSVVRQEAKAASKLFVFLGTKGGVGVTTLAANFALALAQESEGKTLLMDFGLPLGDVSTNLGIRTEYSVVNALKYADRLDARMLASMIAKHSTGLSVLTAPSEFSDDQVASPASIDKLVAVARESYDCVVVDIGSRIDLLGTSLFDKSSVVYLIAQVGITELFNAHRMVSKFFFTRDQSLQIVLNRYKPSDLLFDEKKITEALTRPAQWKIPDDYATARRTRETATPIVMIDSAIARSIREMARTAVGMTGDKIDRKGLFRFLR
ncbi:MAG: AAA family ATPase [Terracidiphilus sp.]